MFKILITFYMTLLQAMHTNGQIPPELSIFGHNKKIPGSIERNVLIALSHFPELKHVRIDFRFKRNLNKSVMQAQPVPATLLQRRGKRRYRINISTEFKLINARLSILDIPDQVLIGWIGHELGHILDYEGRSNAQLVAFGYRYYLFPDFIKKAERTADTLAVVRGLGHHIIATKRFILDHASLPQAYKDKISRLYLSPDVILEQVQKLEEKAADEKDD
ncbi:hypothetical protein [Paracnuella aquatica]|uniref:hypothetical protein n=1 Tax=Paracnuella aquatica TaxID=2268757 RepID=UPI001F4EB316|nr:hypothetical protein [Paracnuella aquatica]